LHLVGILFPNNNDDARSKSLQITSNHFKSLQITSNTFCVQWRFFFSKIVPFMR